MKEDWRQYLTGKEYTDYHNLIAIAHDVDARRKKISEELQKIRTRCAQRRRTAIGNVSGDKDAARA